MWLVDYGMTKFFFVRLICHEAIANRVKNFKVKGKRSLTKTHDYFSWLTLYLLPSVEYSLFVRLYLNTCVLSILRVYVWVFIYVYASDIRIRSLCRMQLRYEMYVYVCTLRTICKRHVLFSTHTFYERLVRQAGNPYILVCTHPEGIILPISYSLKRHLENLAGSRSNDQSASRFRFMPIYGKSCESTRWGKSRLDESISIA